MPTKLSHELSYDAPLADVAAMLRDPAFREQVCDAIGCLRRTVTIDPDGDGMKVVVDMVQAATGIPGFAKKFVGDEINIVQAEQWSDTESGTVEVTIPGKPGHMSGTIRLAESGGTTTETVDMQVRVNIPLVAGRIESLIADMLEKSLQAENTVGRRYLAS